MTEQGKENAGKLSLTKHSRTLCQISKPYAMARVPIFQNNSRWKSTDFILKVIRFDKVLLETAQTLSALPKS